MAFASFFWRLGLCIGIQPFPFREKVDMFQHFLKVTYFFWVSNLLLTVVLDTAKADYFTLYDGTGLPAAQPWFFSAGNNSYTQTGQADGVRLETNLNTSAGYSNQLPLIGFKNPAFPVLNRSNGFELAFRLSVAAETHTSSDRAGFSVTFLGSDKQGVELGFWGNEIWAQQSNPLFTHGEGVTLSTGSPRDYRLQIINDTYTLLDGTAQLLSGAVRDYTEFGGIPYTLSNYVFLGDNTSRGGADILLGTVTLQSNLSAVPEPTSVLLVGTMVVPVLCCFFSIYIRKKFARAVSTGFSVRQGNLKCPVTFGLAASHHRSIELKFDVAVCIDGDQAT